MTFRFKALGLAWLSAQLLLPNIAAADSDRVEVPPDVQSRLGIATAALKGFSAPLVARAYARVLDAGPLAALDADIVVARSAAAASQAEAQRLSALAAVDQGASQHSVEAARATAVADATRVALAERRIAFQWGAGLARLDTASRQRLLTEIAAGDAALVRVDPVETVPGAVVAFDVQGEPGATSFAGELLGPAATVDPRLQTLGRLGVVHGAPARALRPGRVLDGRLITARQVTGVLLPRSALIRTEGATWAWVQATAERFERRKVEPQSVLDDGWLVARGFEAGDMVVTTCAGALLALELGTGSADAEDD